MRSTKQSKSGEGITSLDSAMPKKTGYTSARMESTEDGQLYSLYLRELTSGIMFVL